MSITAIQGHSIKTTINSDTLESVDSNVINGYLILHSIDPSINRFRAYSISITTIQTQDIIYMVRTAWGRISNLYQSRTQLFSSKKDAIQYIYTTLLARKRHDYSLLERSKGFPSIELLHKFSSVPTIESCFSSQLSLF